MNNLLPEELRVEKATGNSGRTTFVTTSFEEGCDATTIAKVTHHMDPKSLNSYKHDTISTLLIPALAIGNAVHRKVDDDLIGGYSAKKFNEEQEEIIEANTSINVDIKPVLNNIKPLYCSNTGKLLTTSIILSPKFVP